MTILANLTADARLYLSLEFPKARLGYFQLAKIWCTSPGLWALAMHRFAHGHAGRSVSGTRSIARRIWPGIAVRSGNYLSRVLVKSEILASTEVAAGIYLSNSGHLVLGARSIGSGTMIHERVTIGMGLPGIEIPAIGRNVWIGPDCVIYGEITVGEGATVLPGSVLTKSIPPGSVVQGNPARIVRRDFENSKLRNSLSTDYESFLGRES
jgi:serine acetyltransferase